MEPACGEGAYLLQLEFGVCALCLRAWCVFVHPSGYVQAITCTFMHRLENNLAPLFALRSSSAI